MVPIKLGVKQKQLQSLNPEHVKRCCASFKSSELRSNLLIRRTVDVNLQVFCTHYNINIFYCSGNEDVLNNIIISIFIYQACSLQDVEIQTILNLPNKMWAQWEPQLRDEDSLTESETVKLKESVSSNSQQ